MATSTVIGQTTFVRGRVSGAGDLEIAGRVEGDITCTGEVVIEASGLVSANVSAGRIVVRGALKGDLVAEEALVIDAGARVVGDLRAPRISIAPGGLVRGHVQTGGAGPPQLRAAAASPARAAVTETRSRPAVAPARVVQVAPPPTPSTSRTNHKTPHDAALAGARVGPPPPVVPVLKKGTKAIQKKHR